MTESFHIFTVKPPEDKEKDTLINERNFTNTQDIKISRY